jgi:hypothetical protein
MADTRRQIEPDIGAALECAEAATWTANELVARTLETAVTGEEAAMTLHHAYSAQVHVARVLDWSKEWALSEELALPEAPPSRLNDCLAWMRRARDHAKLDEPRLLGMKIQSKTSEPLLKIGKELLCFVPMLEANDRVVRIAHDDHGLMTAPCGVPSSVSIMHPSSSTPAVSHLAISRMIRRSPIRCSTKRISHSRLTLSKKD